MQERGSQKRDIQRQVQKVHTGASVSSEELSATKTSTRIEVGFAAEKITVVTTGTLTADVLPKIGNADANATIGASNTASTTTTSNMFSAIEITRTGGEGKVLILAK